MCAQQHHRVALLQACTVMNSYCQAGQRWSKKKTHERHNLCTCAGMSWHDHCMKGQLFFIHVLCWGNVSLTSLEPCHVMMRAHGNKPKKQATSSAHDEYMNHKSCCGVIAMCVCKRLLTTSGSCPTHCRHMSYVLVLCLCLCQWQCFTWCCTEQTEKPMPSTNHSMGPERPELGIEIMAPAVRFWMPNRSIVRQLWIQWARLTHVHDWIESGLPLGADFVWIRYIPQKHLFHGPARSQQSAPRGTARILNLAIWLCIFSSGTN